MVAPPIPILFVPLPVFTVFFAYFGVYICLTYSNKFGHSFEGAYHIYITVDVDKLVRHDGSGIKRS